MRLNPVNRWFRPKTLGFGWAPATAEGWAATLGLVALALLFARSH